MRIYNIRWFKEEGGNISVDLSLCVLLYNTNFKTNLNSMISKKNQKLIDCTNFLLSTKSPHFPLRGKVGQLSALLVYLQLLSVYG